MSGESWGAETFERLYAGTEDPWGFESSPYERAKYADTLAALPRPRYRDALELGCSIGVMSAALAHRCDRLLCLDISATALARARTRCATLPRVRFEQAGLPDGFPTTAPDGAPARYDLVVMSELLYFLSAADLDRLLALVLAASTPDATLLLVNWTGPTDTPCTGDEAAERARARCVEAGRSVAACLHREGYRIDRIGPDRRHGIATDAHGPCRTGSG